MINKNQQLKPDEDLPENLADYCRVVLKIFLEDVVGQKGKHDKKEKG